MCRAVSLGVVHAARHVTGEVEERVEHLWDWRHAQPCEEAALVDWLGHVCPENRVHVRDVERAEAPL